MGVGDEHYLLVSMTLIGHLARQYPGLGGAGKIQANNIFYPIGFEHVNEQIGRASCRERVFVCV